jgi:hypothetical protein
VTEPAERNIAIRCRLARSCACARRVAAASNKPIVKSRLLTQSPRRRSPSSAGGRVRPTALVTLRLITNSYLVGR